jgi:hypothetical protein
MKHTSMPSSEQLPPADGPSEAHRASARSIRSGRWSATLAVSLLLLLPQMSEAQCVCTYLPVCEAYKTSPAVVIAKAVGDQLVVSKVLHGSAPRTIKWQNTGECEAGLQQGEEYLVYPTRYRGTFGVGACTRRMTLAEAAEELKDDSKAGVSNHKRDRLRLFDYGR